MYIKELIEQLQKMNPEAKAFIMDDGRAYCMTLNKVKEFSEQECRAENISFPSVVISSEG